MGSPERVAPAVCDYCPADSGDCVSGYLQLDLTVCNYLPDHHAISRIDNQSTPPAMATDPHAAAASTTLLAMLPNPMMLLRKSL